MILRDRLLWKTKVCCDETFNRTNQRFYYSHQYYFWALLPFLLSFVTARISMHLQIAEMGPCIQLHVRQGQAIQIWKKGCSIVFHKYSVMIGLKLRVSMFSLYHEPVYWCVWSSFGIMLASFQMSFGDLHLKIELFSTSASLWYQFLDLTMVARVLCVKWSHPSPQPLILI